MNLINPYIFGNSFPTDGLQLFYRSDAGVFTDLPGTTPATNDGDTVLRWNDQSGNGSFLGNTANGFKLKTNQINGLSCLRGDGSSEFLTLSNALILPSLTAYALVRVVDSSVHTLLCGLAGSLQWRIDGFKNRAVDCQTADIGFGTNSIPSNTWTQIGISWDRTTANFRMGGMDDGSATLTNSAYGPITAFGVQDGTEFFSQDISCLLLYGVIHDTATKLLVEAYIRSIFGV